VRGRPGKSRRGKVCALSALIAGIDTFRDFGPYSGRSSGAGRGSIATQQAQADSLFERQVDALLAYVAVEEAYDSGPAQALGVHIEGLADAALGSMGRGVEEKAGTIAPVVPRPRRPEEWQGSVFFGDGRNFP
jgi:hypothetical protein